MEPDKRASLKLREDLLFSTQRVTDRDMGNVKLSNCETTELDFIGIGETMALFAPTDGKALSPGRSCVVGAAGAESNVARSLSLLNWQSCWIGTVGEDVLGNLVYQSLQSDGVKMEKVIRDTSRATGALFKSADSPNRGVQYLRKDSAGSHFGDLAFQHALESKSKVTHVSGVTAAISDSGLELTQEIVRKERRGGIVSFDINFRPSLWGKEAGVVLLEISSQADVVFVGLDEAEALWGVTTPEEVRKLFPAVRYLVVKDGGLMATTFSEDGVATSPAPKRKVVELVGAGDAFAAGWIIGLLMEKENTVKMEFGHRLAGVVIASPLDTPSFHDLPELSGMRKIF